MTIKCIALDDEPFALKQIESYIRQTPFLELVALCENAFDALKVLEANNEIQLIFADINMPDLSGMDLVKSLSGGPKVIFTTAYSEYAIEGFQVDALDYLLKPISFTQFLKAANKARHWFELLENHNKDAVSPHEENIFVKSDYKIIKIKMDDILYIESANEYIKIILENGESIMTFMRLKNMEENLPKDKFMRVHRSFIIQLNKIKAVEKNRVMISAKVHIPIGEQYKDTFQQYIDKTFTNN